MKRTEEQIKDLLLEAIEARQIYTIRKLRKELTKIKQEKKQYVLHLPNYKSDK